jgi:hypothetical protein
MCPLARTCRLEAQGNMFAPEGTLVSEMQRESLVTRELVQSRAVENDRALRTVYWAWTGGPGAMSGAPS